MAILLNINADTIKSGVHKARHFLTELTIPNLIDALEEDHDDLRKQIDILKDDECDLSTRRTTYAKFMVLLKSHSKSEEKAVYAVCEKIPTFRRRAIEGIAEHAIAENMMKRIATLRNRDQWAAHVKVLAELIERHVNVEEREFFPSLEAKLDPLELEHMKNVFVSLRYRTQKQVKRDNAGVLAH